LAEAMRLNPGKEVLPGAGDPLLVKLYSTAGVQLTFLVEKAKEQHSEYDAWRKDGSGKPQELP
jgi:hypothetical protein